MKLRSAVLSSRVGRVSLLALVWLVLIGGSARSLAQAPASPGITIESLAYDGSGCPQGSAGQSLNDANTILTLSFDRDVAATGTGVPSEESTRECQVTLNLRVPAGASHTRVRMMLPGYANLSAGMTGVLASSATFNAQTLDSHDESLAGPTADDYLVTREFDLATSEAAEIVLPLTIATSLSLSSSPPDGMLTLDSLSVAVGPDDTVLTLSVSRDTPLPVVEVTPSVLPNANDWNNTDVTVSFTCVPPDGFTVVSEESSLDPVTLTASGTAMGTCVVADVHDSDIQSSASVSYPVQIDKAPPTITVAVPAVAGVYGLGASVASAVSCADATSGIEVCNASAQLDTATLGQHTFSAVATDRAGNTAQRTISYRIGGKNDCKNGGWRSFLVPTFRNQGQCVSSFVP
jgi:uncharacterized protein DUF4360